MESKFFVNFLIAAYQTFGRDGLKRMVTLPEADVRKICKRTGADPDEAIAARNEWAETTLFFIEEMALSDR